MERPHEHVVPARRHVTDGFLDQHIALIGLCLPAGRFAGVGHRHRAIDVILVEQGVAFLVFHTETDLGRDASLSARGDECGDQEQNCASLQGASARLARTMPFDTGSTPPTAIAICSKRA